METNAQPQTAAARFRNLLSKRESFLLTARDCAALTVPFVLPPEGSKGQLLESPNQSVGSRGVNNLAAKLLLALLPTNTPFFKLAVDRFALKALSDNAKLKTKLEEALSEVEQATMTEIETSAVRPTVFESLVHLIVSGNGLVEVPASGPLKFYSLERYVVQRDPMGHPKLIIIHEQVAPAALPEKFLASIKGQNPLTQKGAPDGEPKKDVNKDIDLYTVCERVNADRWAVWQEAGGERIPGTNATYPNDKLPFIPLRFYKVDGEDYGRGHVEQYLGDLISLDGLSKAITEGALAASRVLFLTNPNGITDAKTCAEASNGDFVPGREEDVKPLQMGKFADFRTAKEQADVIEQRLNAAFMVTAGLQRDAERVTAEEIRALIQELETALGGVHSILAQEYQLPLASALMNRMSKDKRLPKLPKKVVAPTITTGVEALGRGNDLQKLDMLVKDIAATFGPEAIPRYVNASEYLSRRAAALGITTKGLIRTEEEVNATDQQLQQQAQTAGLVEKVAPVVAKGVLQPSA